MKKDLAGLELIKAYRAHPECFYPFLDRRGQVAPKNKYGEVNIGWNAGLLEGDRPFFAECWGADHMTTLSIYVSAKGIEDIAPEELEKMILDSGYFSYREDGYQTPQVNSFKNSKGEEFFLFTVGVGVEDEPALIDGAKIYPWSVLNEYNAQF